MSLAESGLHGQVAKWHASLQWNEGMDPKESLQYNIAGWFPHLLLWSTPVSFKLQDSLRAGSARARLEEQPGLLHVLLSALGRPRYNRKRQLGGKGMTAVQGIQNLEGDRKWMRPSPVQEWMS